MKGSVEDKEVELFLSNLFHSDNSTAARAYASYFITTYRRDIEAYIKNRISLSGANYGTVTWARNVGRLLRKYEYGPKGYVYNAHTGTLESLYAFPLQRPFRLSRDQRRSLTFATDRRLMLLAGYVVACLGIGTILLLGYAFKKAIDEFGEKWIAAIEKRLAE
jgi:hypothetical protein